MASVLAYRKKQKLWVSSSKISQKHSCIMITYMDGREVGHRHAQCPARPWPQRRQTPLRDKTSRMLSGMVLELLEVLLLRLLLWWLLLRLLLRNGSKRKIHIHMSSPNEFYLPFLQFFTSIRYLPCIPQRIPQPLKY